jgi:DNA-binding FadR family transcriptional regulator
MVVRDHERIVETIREGDGEGSWKQMNKHLDNLMEGIQALKLD